MNLLKAHFSFNSGVILAFQWMDPLLITQLLHGKCGVLGPVVLEACSGQAVS